MRRQVHPEGIDCVWLASDREGYLGAFITAGVGPIPAEILVSDNIAVGDIEGRLCQLPIVSQVQLLVSVKRPDDFVSLASRGLFVYDWTDTNRKEVDALSVYEPVAVPDKPITTTSLPSDLEAMAKLLRLVNVVFSSRDAVDISANLVCAGIT